MGVKIFASKKRPIEIPPKQVVEYLEQFGLQVVQMYLEFIILECNNQDSEFHTKLAILYVDILLLTSNELNHISPGSELGLTGLTRKKLLQHLESSHSYNEAIVLTKIVTSTLYEACIILYTRLKRHYKSLEILVDKLHDTKRAEEYCATFKQEDPELTLSLFKVYLNQPKADNEFISPFALNLLSSQAIDLNPEMVLPLLPKEIPVQLICDYLTKSIRQVHHNLRDGQITKNLLKSDRLNLKYQLSILTDKSVTITKDKMCPICNKYIGDKVFAYYPNGTIVHFKCFKDQTIDPVTGYDFKKNANK